MREVRLAYMLEELACWLCFVCLLLAFGLLVACFSVACCLLAACLVLAFRLFVVCYLFVLERRETATCCNRCVYVCMCMWIYIYIYVCICMYMYIYIYIYTCLEEHQGRDQPRTPRSLLLQAGFLQSYITVIVL